MAAGCLAITERATDVLGSEEGRSLALELLERGAAPSAFVDALASQCDPDTASLLREEMAELPSNLVETIVNSWVLAAAAGKSFQLRSVPPREPLDFARNRRVRLAVDVEDDGVIVSLSHIPGRHAAWAQPVAVAG